MKREKRFPILLFACLSLLALGGGLCLPVQAANDVAVIGVLHLAAFNISVSAIHETDATITWNTNWDANSSVQYGPTTSYGSVRTNSSMVTSHTLILDGLSPGIIYHFRVISADLFGNRYVSPDFQFTTAGNPPTPPDGGIHTGGDGGSFSLHLTPGTCRATPQGVITPVTEKGLLTSCTIISSVNGMTDLRSSWSVYILENPPAGARFVTYILPGPSDPARSAIDAELSSQGHQISAIAYVMEVVKYPPLELGTTTIQMDVERSWVNQNGGPGAVRIISVVEDGLVRVLDTKFSNYAMGTGHMNFRAISSGDLSLYALIAVEAAPGTVPTSPIPTETAPPTGPVTGPTPFPALTPAVFLMLVVLPLGIVIVSILWMIRARGKRKMDGSPGS